MAIVKHVVKSCCDSKSYVFETQTAISRNHLPAFQQAGYSTPPHYQRNGLFKVIKPNFVASASFGSTKIQVQASGKIAAQLLDQFEKLLDELTKK